MTPIGAVAIAGCIAISAATDRITLADLAPAFGIPSPINGAAAVGYAPAPGVRRVFTMAELQRVAARFQLAAVPEREICVERPVAPLTEARLLESMQRALPEARIAIAGFSRQPVPEGEIDFPVSGLRQTSAGEFWNGSIRYAGSRRFAIWAKVEVRLEMQRVLAASDLPAGRPIAAEQLRLETGDVFPGSGPVLKSIEAAAGRVLRRSVRAGTPLLDQWLDTQRDVARGDTVRVEVSSGNARLEMQAMAEGGGSVGETVLVRNLETKRTFRARIEGKGKVSVGR